jgi:hypothetical protein
VDYLGCRARSLAIDRKQLYLASISGGNLHAANIDIATDNLCSVRCDRFVCCQSCREIDLDHVFWRWLASNDRSMRSDLLLRTSCGLRMTDDIRFPARLLCQIFDQEREVELQLRIFLNHSQFQPCREVLTRSGMGGRLPALIISQIYPRSNFLSK